MKSLHHNGVSFPEPYKSLDLVFTINGIDRILTLEQQKMIMAWAKKAGTPYWNDPVFRKNFFTDFCKSLNIDYSEDFDLVAIGEIIAEEKQKKLDMAKEEKKRATEERKKIRDERKAKYGYAIVDGKQVELANYIVEPAGIMMGRAMNPLRGRWKRSIKPEDITLNLSPDASNLKELQAKGFKIEWHNDQMWIAKWEDPLYPKEYKYIWLADTYETKQKKEKAKFDNAWLLDSKMEELDELLKKALIDSNEKRRKVATVVWLIKETNMRVGDEHETGEADTVGACLLEKSHLTIKDHDIHLDFIGKDSVSWIKDIKAPDEVINNLNQFISKANPRLFDGINSQSVSKFLGEIMEGATAKVFRTYAASRTFRDFLEENMVSKEAKEYQKKILFQKANLEVAKKLNHKKALPKNFDDQIKRYEERIKKVKEAKKPNLDKVKKMEMEFQLKKDMAEWNGNTSKNSYIDPRITIEFCKEIEFPKEKFYNQNQLKKFSWAFQ